MFSSLRKAVIRNIVIASGVTKVLIAAKKQTEDQRRCKRNQGFVEGFHTIYTKKQFTQIIKFFGKYPDFIYTNKKSLRPAKR